MVEGEKIFNEGYNKALSDLRARVPELVEKIIKHVKDIENPFTPYGSPKSYDNWNYTKSDIITYLTKE